MRNARVGAGRIGSRRHARHSSDLETTGQSDRSGPAAFSGGGGPVKRRGKWHIQVYTRLSVIEGSGPGEGGAERLCSTTSEGRRRRSAEQPGFDTLLTCPTGKAYVKISGADTAARRSRRTTRTVAPLAKALMGESATHLWGATGRIGVARGPPPGHRISRRLWQSMTADIEQLTPVAPDAACAR